MHGLSVNTRIFLLCFDVVSTGGGGGELSSAEGAGQTGFSLAAGRGVAQLAQLAQGGTYGWTSRLAPKNREVSNFLGRAGEAWPSWPTWPTAGSTEGRDHASAHAPPRGCRPLAGGRSHRKASPQTHRTAQRARRGPIEAPTPSVGVRVRGGQRSGMRPSEPTCAPSVLRTRVRVSQ